MCGTPQASLTLPAVAGRLERGVRPHTHRAEVWSLRGSHLAANFTIQWVASERLAATGVGASKSESVADCFWSRGLPDAAASVVSISLQAKALVALRALKPKVECVGPFFACCDWAKGTGIAARGWICSDFRKRAVRNVGSDDGDSLAQLSRRAHWVADAEVVAADAGHGFSAA
jgi:hypothetical protein